MLGAGAARAMESKTSLGRGVRPLQGGGGIFKSAAVAVLREERRLMTTGEITKCDFGAYTASHGVPHGLAGEIWPWGRI